MSTSLPSAADTRLRQNDSQITTVIGRNARSRFYSLRGMLMASRSQISSNGKGRWAAAYHQECGAPAISGHERHGWVTESDHRDGWRLRFFKTPFYGLTDLPMRFLGMCSDFYNSDMERSNSRNSARDMQGRGLPREPCTS